ncbi:hypothetical protein GGS23DRAFT_104379 [Durotheca rogersii]|uniref:uncharacterized protein n=1 Tax=Durotheca rogersii TaxID=419775 RepID=UPI002220262E|nr:uncharacterized protein GGS23DRAFT_104379 [Durotheca rogersii]KAI5862087.1 hypothetical protein GGS23DRAFT_104379 [Durotheca rogersii]
MGINCGFDIYPPLERTHTNQALYERFLHDVLVSYGLPHDGRPHSDAGDGNNAIISVNTESKTSYIEFLVGEHPCMPRRCENFLRFSSKVSGSSTAEPHIRTVYKIARQYLGDRVYRWHEMNEFGPYIHMNGCYSWTEIYAARRRIEEPEDPEEPKHSAMSSDVLQHVEDGADKMLAMGISETKLYDVKPVSGKGQGVIATSNIPKGTRILLEAPLFKLPETVPDSIAEAVVVREVKTLSRCQQREFFSLRNVHRHKCNPFLGIVQTNMLPLTEDEYGNGGLFLQASRLNHSCQPNAQHTWNASLGCLTVHALNDIEAGDEITISYFSGVSMERTKRQRHLRDGFCFSCTCKLCSLPPPARLRSDDRLAQIWSIQEDCDAMDADAIYRRPLELFRQAQQLLRLLDEEDTQDIRRSKAYFAAFLIAVTVGDKPRAKVLAERAYIARKLISGEDNPVTASFKRLMERPVEHPSYGAAMKCYGDRWDPPRHVDGEELEKWLWNPDEWSRYSLS